MELEEVVLTPGERARGADADSVVFSMDWTGEESPGELASFVAGRVRSFGADPADVDTAAVYRAAEADPAPGRGDFPVRQLDHLSGVLARLGCTLLVWDTGTDTYELLVALTDGREPAGLTHHGLPVRPWGSPSETVLISLDCPSCGRMAVWELPTAEADRALAGERCDCGAALFDATGRPLPGVTLHG
ncbi:hypothetical protein ACIQ9E_07700 [Streptomyces sp. NPDC094448]|uniref:DUF6630 family protein n=1 Tax=Streptomyces sp. NPDC094448 TaxID=3366063 RepID=UPI0038260B78